MSDEKKCKETKCPAGSPEYMATYGDMVTLLLVFFVLLYSQMVEKAEVNTMQLILATFQGLGNLNGGNTFSEGKLAELGMTAESMPSRDNANSLSKSIKLAESLLQQEVKDDRVKIIQTERGLIVSLSGDAFFNVASAEVKIENTRETLQKIALLLNQVINRSFKIEGHTDDIDTDPGGPWRTNWELASDRATNVLYYLNQFGVNQENFQVVSYGSQSPLADNTIPEGKSYNRRVDIVIVSEGNL